jgi:hypothetical protein
LKLQEAPAKIVSENQALVAENKPSAPPVAMWGSEPGIKGRMEQ